VSWVVPEGGTGGGRTVRRTPVRSIHLRLQVVPLDPWMESLYEIVSMGSFCERDIMMERMSMARLLLEAAFVEATL
jgi:hypothetical protein